MQKLPNLFPGGIQLLLAPQPWRRFLITHLAVRLAQRGPVCILDGGNHFDLRGLARELRRQTRHYHAALAGVYVARAFTCYQMTTLLAETHTRPIPTLVPDLLTTFQDTQVALSERQRLLYAGIRHLQRLSSQAILLVSADPQTPEPLPSLVSIAEKSWQFDLPETHPQNRSL